jgi:hypothetical protein
MKSIASHNNDQNVFKTIFIDHWDSFKQKRPSYDTPQYKLPVQKMLDCGRRVEVIVNTDALIVEAIHSEWGSVVKVVFVYRVRRFMLMNL